MSEIKNKILIQLIILFGFSGFGSTQVFAEELRVAVASNFYPTMKKIVDLYELKKTNLNNPHKVILISGSSGKHFAQIINGAPFDIFFSADEEKPRLLEKQGKVEPDSRFTYAKGKLVLWSPRNDFVDSSGEILKQDDFKFLAIANPKIAPYGKSAEETLKSLKLWKKMQKKIVRGENIGQTFQFVRSGNAQLGFVAYSQIIGSDNIIDGSFWEIPESIYTPINQQAVLLKASNAGKDFLSFIQSDESLSIILKSGYALP